ncbi:histidine kinase/response regulator hybrid protein [Arenimonas soli]|uniref:histidine kinase n=1 Tax=Arenimonas soli TaxID=2269504 RepID=A0ABQ1HUC5_9GAMM|nr:ATP-binding protein [Arenimonas soli]GGA87888.1 histidine kinase/response regulator hybrid protein [Arenimonas soli]
MRARRSIAGILALVGAGVATVSVALALVLAPLLGSPLLAGLVAVAAGLLLSMWAMRRAVRPVLSLFRALAGTTLSYRDGDFSFGLRWPHRDELGDLVAAHNELGGVLREQRLALVQRELLLDTMVQNTPVAMLLVADGGHVVYANLAARRLLNDGRKIEGLALEALVQAAPSALAEALARGGDGLFSVGEGEEEDVYHLARRGFRLNGRPHELLLLRQLTTELRRQEVQTWKKVIRVISHELNNSLAPVASLAHSGAELTRRGQTEKLEAIFAMIEERARHLEGFIRGYARFAKLPTPRLEATPWTVLVDRLRSQISFGLDGELPPGSVRVDVPQMEQALLNLLKNAHESGSTAEDVQLRVRRGGGVLRIEVLDRGTGMGEAVLANALVPFYSTKRSGTGLGLALAREIAEAHGGRIGLSNRDGGGLQVSLVLPVADD